MVKCQACRPARCGWRCRNAFCFQCWEESFFFFVTFWLGVRTRRLWTFVHLCFSFSGTDRLVVVKCGKRLQYYCLLCSLRLRNGGHMTCNSHRNKYLVGVGVCGCGCGGVGVWGWGCGYVSLSLSHPDQGPGGAEVERVF